MQEFKKYRATKRNVILLESAMEGLGYGTGKIKAEVDYKAFKNSYWFNMFSLKVNFKMQEIEQVGN